MSQESTHIIDALTKQREAGGKHHAQGVFMALLLMMFFIILLVAIVTGVSVYRSVAGVQSTNSENRLGLGLVANCVRANDAQDAVAVGEGPEGRSLVFVEELDSGTFETRIYLSEGKIVQEYSLASAPYTPAKATELAESSTFQFSYSDGLLTIVTDQGTANVALRSTQGS